MFHYKNLMTSHDQSVLKTISLACMALSLSCLTACGGGTSQDTPASITPPSASPPPPAPPPAAPATEQRYIDRIFGSVDRTSNIVFGSGARSTSSQSLEMDIYTPRGDSETERAVIILAFGGGFTTGFRRDPLISSIAIEFAQRGFVTASIDYRLFEETPTDEDALNIAIIEAMHDMKAAVRFLREDALGADIYGTRADAIFVGGVSAGGIMASFSGALDSNDTLTAPVSDFLAANNGTDGNSSSNTQICSDIQGVFSFSGAVTDFQWIDAGSAPIYAAHEEFDTVVPCRFSMASSGAFFAGGCDMVERAEAAGVPAELFLVEGSDSHIGYSLSQYAEIFQGAASFIADQIPN